MGVAEAKNAVVAVVVTRTTVPVFDPSVRTQLNRAEWHGRTGEAVAMTARSNCNPYQLRVVELICAFAMFGKETD